MALHAGHDARAAARRRAQASGDKGFVAVAHRTQEACGVGRKPVARSYANKNHLYLDSLKSNRCAGPIPPSEAVPHLAFLAMMDRHFRRWTCSMTSKTASTPRSGTTLPRHRSPFLRA